MSINQTPEECGRLRPLMGIDLRQRAQSGSCNLPAFMLALQKRFTTLENGNPLSNVEMKGTLDTGDVQPFEVKGTNIDGNVDFRITVLVTQISQTPIATVAFYEPNIYGDASCTVDFSGGGSTENDIDWTAIINRSEWKSTAVRSRNGHIFQNGKVRAASSFLAIFEPNSI